MRQSKIARPEAPPLLKGFLILPHEHALKLNAEQKKSVLHADGPLLIIAGAGTGKTTVITERIAHLITGRKINPSSILALTFTDKAAYQMQEKVDILVPYGFTDTWISTFHAFGDRILRDNALLLGLDPDFKVLTPPQAGVLFRENLFKFELKHFRPLGNPAKFVEAMVSHFSRSCDEDVSPKEYLAFAQKLKEQSAADPSNAVLREEAGCQMELAKCYQTYQELLMKEGLVDFANQFFLALRLLREHPSVLKKYQEQFRYILVDEFQDTNYAQFELVKLLAASSRNLTVVADDDQSIYKWRGAAVSNILHFMDTYPDAEKIALTENYRSTQPILDAAYKMIQNNNPDRFEVRAKISKKLKAQRTKGPAPEHYHFDTLSSESDWVAEYIRKSVEEGRYAYNDFAILVRSNASADPFIRSLNMRGIPWQFSGNQGLYTREEVRLCLAFLRVMANPADSLSLFHLATSSIFNVPVDELAIVMSASKRKLEDLYSALKNIRSPQAGENAAKFSEAFWGAADKLIKDVAAYIERSRTLTTGRLLYTFLFESGYIKGLLEKPTAASEEILRNIARFFDVIKNFENVAKEDRVLYFISYLDMLINVGDDPAVAEAELDTPAVNVLTIHKAKGLEFPVVFLVSLIEAKFPASKHGEIIELPGALIKDTLPLGDFHIQEERRLFYVGMTRAKDELFLTSAMDYGTKKPRKISRFVKETVGEEKEEAVIKSSALEAIERNAPPTPAGVTPPAGAPRQLKEGDILTLSYYQIDDYQTCPLKYKYVHILRVPIMQHHTVAYGKAIHEAVQFYHQAKMAGKKVSEDDVFAAFEKAFVKEGFLTREHVELRLASAAGALKKFFHDQEKAGIVPTFIEKDFSFTLGPNRIAGRWDCVTVTDGVATVIDFKSSEVDDQKDANKKAKDSLQLNLYSLAYEKMTGERPGFKELHFIDTGLVGRAEVTDKDMDKVVKAVTEVSAGIRAGNFEARPGYNACVYCAYNQICPAADIRRF